MDKAEMGEIGEDGLNRTTRLYRALCEVMIAHEQAGADVNEQLSAIAEVMSDVAKANGINAHEVLLGMAEVLGARVEEVVFEPPKGQGDA